MQTVAATAFPTPATAQEPIEIVETTLMPSRQPRLRRRCLESSLWHEGSLVTPLVTGADSLGEFALLDVCLQRGCELPAHTHRREDETYVVLEGRLRFYVDNEELLAGPGDTVHLPRNRRHWYRLESDYARVLLHVAPAGLEHFYGALSEPARALIVPPLPPEGPDVARLATVAARFGITFD
ncbi:cupin domain-containing protein [Hymenobacter sp. 15J16-1T3B]|uniref:cupin domain-containing protein n=1 Tax=Hymenobacter sp. 15J16-1T3B TaxID=2886941 RepID=UPI001D1070EA|nr:cupin domain-containing protein [Hymenobacter sp. 15J16-1T3B]MCC3155739.1 cupin domain-containing protein [Hymenobacter sp. 15J16-1T3B]